MTGTAIGRRLAQSGGTIRCFLFYGADDAGSRALAAQAQASIASDVERIDLTSAQLKSDPALLADEAASRSLFGTARCIRVDGAGDDCAAAVEILMDAPAGDPVILLAGALRKDARLLKCLEGDSTALVHASHPPDLGDLAGIAIAEGQGLGLRIDREIAGRLAEACGGDRAILASEVAKLADYADAAPDAPHVATEAMLDAIAADSGDVDLDTFLDALFSGNVPALDAALGRVRASDGIPLVRATQRRLLTLAAARADMDRGATVQSAIGRLGRAVFWRDRDRFARDLPRWSARRLAVAMERAAGLERALKSSSGPGAVAAHQLFHALARTVRR